MGEVVALGDTGNDGLVFGTPHPEERCDLEGGGNRKSRAENVLMDRKKTVAMDVSGRI